MHYLVKSEYGVKKFKKIKTLKDFLVAYLPRWSHKLRVYKRMKDGTEICGALTADKRIISF